MPLYKLDDNLIPSKNHKTLMSGSGEKFHTDQQKEKWTNRQSKFHTELHFVDPIRNVMNFVS